MVSNVVYRFCLGFSLYRLKLGLIWFVKGSYKANGRGLTLEFNGLSRNSIGFSLLPSLVMSILVALVIVGIFNRSQGSSRLSMDSRCSYSWIRSRYFYFKFKRTIFF